MIFNFAAINTNEGKVLQKLLERLKEIRRELGTDQVFDVVGEVLPSNLLEKMFRDLYAKKTNVPAIEARIVRDVDPERFREITNSTLEGLAKRELNLSALFGKSAEARERRLVPEVVEDFFINAGPVAGIYPKEIKKDSHIYRIGKVPRPLLMIGERNEMKFGKLGKEYKNIVFDKESLKEDPTLEWTTPGHPLFEAVREDVVDRVNDHLRRGAVFYDLHRNDPYRIDVFSASIKDGRNNAIHRRLFAIETDISGGLIVRQPTILLDLTAAQAETSAPDDSGLPSREQIELVLIEKALRPLLREVEEGRKKEIDIITRHMEISLNELINRQNLRLAELTERKDNQGDTSPQLAGAIKQAEDRLDELNHRLEKRREELLMESHFVIGDIEHIGRAWALPHPERTKPHYAPMVRDEEIERIGMEEARKYEEARGWVVEDVSAESRGFDLISRKPHPHDEKTFTEVRFIEVKGRATVGEIALTSNEYKTAERLKKDYWLYVVFNCAAIPKVHPVQDPSRLGWEPLVKVEHWYVGADAILKQTLK